jgi:hypothetical protein
MLLSTYALLLEPLYVAGSHPIVLQHAVHALRLLVQREQVLQQERAVEPLVPHPRYQVAIHFGEGLEISDA